MNFIGFVFPVPDSFYIYESRDGKYVLKEERGQNCQENGKEILKK